MNIEWLQFHFLRPWWLLTCIPLIIVWILLRKKYFLQSSAWHSVCDDHLLSYLLVAKNSVGAVKGLYYLGCLWLLAVLALAGPTASKMTVPVYQSPQSRLIVLSLSPTMLVQDLKPSRLERAKYKVIDILKMSEGRSVGLVVFSGTAHAVTPLTTDIKTIINQMPALSPDIMPKPGNEPVLGLTLAKTLLERTGHLKDAEVILLTDRLGGIETQLALNALIDQGVHLGILGVGTESGGPIPAEQGGFLLDPSGKVMLSQLDVQSIANEAAQVGAYYQTLGLDHADLDHILNQNSKMFLEKSQVKQAEIWQDQGVFLIWIMLVVIMLSFRQGLLGIPLLSLFLMGFMPHTAEAGLWDELWRNQNEQALYNLDHGQPLKAAEQFDSHIWKGVAYYRAEQYEQALAAFKQENTADAYYNQGNALAHLKQYDQAIAAYDLALKQDPNLQDAVANKALVEEIKKNEAEQKKSEAQDHEKNHTGQTSDQKKPEKGHDPAENQSSEGHGSQSESMQNQSTDSNQDQKNADHSALNEAVESGAKTDHEMNRLLNQVPDDQSGLLRRQFQAEYLRREQSRGK